MASDAQVQQRRTFSRAVACFRRQPLVGGVEPPEIGYRARQWWYDQSISSGMFYYNYFMQQTLNAMAEGGSPDWCITEEDGLDWCHIQNDQPNNSWYRGSPLQLIRGNASGSGIYTGDVNSRVNLQIFKFNCTNGYPAFMSASWNPAQYQAQHYIVPFDPALSFNDRTWNNTNKTLSGTTYFISNPGQFTIYIPLHGLPVINGICCFMMGTSVGAETVNPNMIMAAAKVYSEA